MRLRVLHVVSGLGYGGIETFLKSIVKYLPQEEVEVSILCTSPKRGDLEGFFEQYCHIYHLPDDRSRRSRQNGRKEFFKAHKNAFDIIHIHAVGCTVYATAEIAKKYQNCKIVIHAHIASDYSFKTKIINSLARVKLNKVTDLAIGCSRNSAMFLFGKKYGSKAVIINNGIEIERFMFDENARRSMRKSFDIPDDCFVMGSIGRMSPQKNLLFLIDIFSCYTKLNANSKLLLVGDGECKCEIIAKINKLGLEDKVICTGAREDIPNLLQSMDCFMLPSFFEGLAISAVEAQANGLTCFISDTVTRDIDISKRNVFCDINKPAAVWADIVDHTNCDRADHAALLRTSGFNAKQSALHLLQAYRQVVRVG